MIKHYIKYYDLANLEKVVEAVGITKEIISVCPYPKTKDIYMVIFKEIKND